MSAVASVEALRARQLMRGYPESGALRPFYGELGRFCLDLDALGRRSASGNVLVEEQTLRAMLLDRALPGGADSVADALKNLPGHSFRVADRLTDAMDEIPWFSLAEAVVVFDPDRQASFTDLSLPPVGGGREVAAAVLERFPSLEPELLDVSLAKRLRTLPAAPGELRTRLGIVERQLGWWAGLTLALMAGAAYLGAAQPATLADAPAWPLAMFVLAGAIGGWTLTVVGSCILAPHDS